MVLIGGIAAYLAAKFLDVELPGIIENFSCSPDEFAPAAEGQGVRFETATLLCGFIGSNLNETIYAIK